MNFDRPIKSSTIGTVIRIPLILLIALLPGLFVSGQVKFTTVASSQEVGRGEYLQIEFVVENARQIDQLTPPEFPNFHIAQGPIQSSGMSVVNGNMSQYKALSFVLQPTRTGKFTIGGASAMVDGKHMQSNSITITVTATSSGAAGNNSPNNNNGSNGLFPPSMPDPFGNSEPEQVDREYVLKPGENIKDKIRKNLFVRVQVDKNSCYVGEPIVATYKLYSRLSSESRVTKRPSLNGFSVYDMIDPNADAVSVEKLNGKAYTVHIIRKTQLIPLQAGTIDLDPVEVENTVHFVRKAPRQDRRHSGNAIRDLFDQLADDNDLGPEVDDNITLDTKPLPITVKPLPEENKPANFNGAVGKFSIEASLANKSLAAQDEGTLHVVVKGEGNLPVINAPQVAWPNGFEAFDPTAKEDVNKTVSPMRGSKSFDYLFTSRVPGHYTIPAIAFPYFDPSSQSYKTAETASLDIQIAPPTHKPGSASPASGILAAASDANNGLASRVGTFIQRRLEWIFTVLILSMIAIYLWRQNRRLKKGGIEQDNAGSHGQEDAARRHDGAGREQDGVIRGQDGSAYDQGVTTSAIIVPVSHSSYRNEPTIDRQEHQQDRPDRHQQDRPDRPDRPERIIPEFPAPTYVPASITTDPLQEVRQLFDSGDYKGFYREVNRAIWKAIGKKLDLPASELNKHNITRQLQLRGWDAHQIFLLENLLNECEMSLYTPAYDTYNMQQLLRQAESMLAKLA